MLSLWPQENERRALHCAPGGARAAEGTGGGGPPVRAHVIELVVRRGAQGPPAPPLGGQPAALTQGVMDHG